MTELEIATVPLEGTHPPMEDKKHDAMTQFVEDPSSHDDQGLLKSRFDELSITRTFWLFRWSALYAIMAYSMSTIDSWQVRLDGEVFADSIGQYRREHHCGAGVLEAIWREDRCTAMTDHSKDDWGDWCLLTGY